MRETKFRAQDLELEKYIYSYDNKNHDNNFYYHLAEFFKTIHIEPERYIIEQYAGLKDSENKDKGEIIDALRDESKILCENITELESQNKELVEGLGHVLFNDYFDSYEKAKEIYDKYKVSQ